MGLGKTLTTLSLLVLKKGTDQATVRRVEGTAVLFFILLASPSLHILLDLMSINATLIVVPASLLHMWETEIRDKEQAGVFRVMLYHGPSCPKDLSV